MIEMLDQIIGQAGYTMLVTMLAAVIYIVVRRFWLEKPPEVESHSERLSSLMQSLTRASSEVDNILAELARMASQRENAVQELEARLSQLGKRELQLQERIQHLQEIPLPVAEHFAAIVAQGERRAAWRDYALFALGVVVSVFVGIVLRLAGLG